LKGQLAFEHTPANDAVCLVDDRAIARPARATGLVALFASTLFLSAFLSFAAEPMVAKMVLPILGGAPMVWNSCVMFFQLALLAGYGYAYGASRQQSVRRQLALHAALLLIPFIVLPVMIDRGTAAPPDGNPVGWLLVLLAGSIGLPFFVLSSTASMLQLWFSRTNHPGARDPYFLYAASNLGSLLALASYPVLVEPFLTLGAQSRLWAGGYAAFVVLTGACALASCRQQNRDRVPVIDEDDSLGKRESNATISTARRARWVAASFIPSSLMLAVTSYLSTDIAAVPLLWIVPLALYLLTFVVAFSSKASQAGTVARRAVPLLIVPLVLLMTTRADVSLSMVFPLHLAAFVFVALLCHCELARDRPSATHLTEFYFWISFGGMLGGTFNTLVAPAIFSGIGEYPLALVLACLWLPRADSAVASRRAIALDWGLPLAIGVLTAGALVWAGSHRLGASMLVTALACPALASFGQKRRPSRFAFSLGAMLLAGSWFGGDSVLYRSRTFFGVYRVSVDRSGRHHALTHGTTLHGMQALDPVRRSEPLTYYHRTGPFGQALAKLPNRATAQQIAVIGLGVGTLAAYVQPGQQWTFFEIDPEVERIARTSAYFTYLDSCQSQCRVVLGDARLSLARDSASRYDLIVLDAFSSDAIPMHLLTREALSLYVSRLAPGGALAFHISNIHLSLSPIIARLAEDHGLVAIDQMEHRTADWPEEKKVSRWSILARNDADLGALNQDPRWTRLIATTSVPLWTDDFSNLVGVLNINER
jgi:spermidine synthase